MQFEVLTTQWTADDDVFAGGTHEITKPAADFLRLLAGAEAAGSVRILGADPQQRDKLDSLVQSQQDGEAALSEAMGAWVPAVYRDVTNEQGQVVHRELAEPGRWAGDWHDANVEQFELDVRAGIRNPTLAEETA